MWDILEQNNIINFTGKETLVALKEWFEDWDGIPKSNLEAGEMAHSEEHYGSMRSGVQILVTRYKQVWLQV